MKSVSSSLEHLKARLDLVANDVVGKSPRSLQAQGVREYVAFKYCLDGGSQVFMTMNGVSLRRIHLPPPRPRLRNFAVEYSPTYDEPDTCALITIQADLLFAQGGSSNRTLEVMSDRDRCFESCLSARVTAIHSVT